MNPSDVSNSPITSSSNHASVMQHNHPEPQDGKTNSRTKSRISLGKRSISHETARNSRAVKSSGITRRDATMVNPGSRLQSKDMKLGMFSGVFVPTCLNVLSILMFLRFGFILGQAGLLGTMGMLIASYLINLVTTFSLSAIASNGTVRGGGAYFLISRSLGPEFGGSIGLIFYLGLVFNTGLNAVGLIDCIKLNFGSISGNWANILPESPWYLYLWSTIVLIACTGICFAGSSIFARASNALLIVLLVATLSIPFSAIFVSPYIKEELGIEYTGLNWTTFVSNLKPQLTKGAAGSHLHGRENYQDLFGILFPATGGIFAGASMSGDLRNPSKSIPKGTLYGLGATFALYTIVILAMASTITRASFVRNANIVQDTNVSGLVVLAGELASALFSTIMGVIGSAKLLQALARDNLLPGFSTFSQGTKNGDEPINAIVITYIIAQITMLFDLNKIASFITMTYLMTFLVMNLACFLLKIGSAPNFRPSFHFFNWQTALFGTIISAVAMIFADSFYATGCVSILISIFIIIHYTSPPKSWGDVSQSLIYHQVRKYLLRLKQEHVKFWRPQILLFVNDPRRQYKLIQFCNSMKKGSLYVLGHVIVTDDFGGSVPEARRQQAAWTKYIDFSKIKAFVDISISNGFEWGARNIVLSAGLGGMRPNIAVIGFYNLDDLRSELPLIDVSDLSNNVKKSSPNTAHSDLGHTNKGDDSRDEKIEGVLPTDSCKTEGMISVTSYLTLLEDLLLRLHINVAVARGFNELKFPSQKNHGKRFIDLWPIQMSAEIATGGINKQNVMTTNFDTYTLILQLGAILNTVSAWKKEFKLRVVVFVEYESDVEEERGRVESLLENLRIEAEVIVFWLASGSFLTYEIIVNGNNPDEEAEKEIEKTLQGQDWWDELQRIRGKRGPSSGTEDLLEIANLFKTGTTWPDSSFQQGPGDKIVKRFRGLRRLLRKSKGKQIVSIIKGLDVSLGMHTHRLSERHTQIFQNQTSASEESISSSSFESDLDSTDSTESAASEGDIEELDLVSRNVSQNAATLSRRRSFDDCVKMKLSANRLGCEKNLHEPDIMKRTVTNAPGTSNPTHIDQNLKILERPMTTILQKSNLKATMDTKMNPKTPTRKDFNDIIAKSRNSTLASSSQSSQNGSGLVSQPKFSSKPVPIPRVATEDGPGPSIMFAENPSPINRNSNCIFSVYSSERLHENTPDLDERSPQTRRGSSYSAQNLPLSFNDLPRRAQHLIINELIRSNSKETAVMFTTLPSPIEGTCQSEEASIEYLRDLELLCRECPPVLMVHSNSMTVTVSL